MLYVVYVVGWPYLASRNAVFPKFRGGNNSCPKLKTRFLRFARLYFGRVRFSTGRNRGISLPVNNNHLPLHRPTISMLQKFLFSLCIALAVVAVSASVSSKDTKTALKSPDQNCSDGGGTCKIEHLIFSYSQFDWNLWYVSGSRPLRFAVPFISNLKRKIVDSSVPWPTVFLSNSVYLWCANYGDRCVQPLPNRMNTHCCGCVGAHCYTCDSSASCAAWSADNPNGAKYCPYPVSNNSTRFGTCKWVDEKIDVRAKGPEFLRAVFRCHSVSPPSRDVKINWDVRTVVGGGVLKIQVLNQISFDIYSSGSHAYKCLNSNCLQPAKITRDHVEAHGSPAYYIIITGTEDGIFSLNGSINWSFW